MFRKGVTVERIGEHLRRFGWDRFQAVPEFGEKEGLIQTGWNMAGRDHAVYIDPMVERGLLLFVVRGVVKAPPDSTAADRLEGLLLAMTTFNYKLIVGAWAYDPTDGEVVFKLGLPIRGGTLEYEDFELALTGIVAAVESQGEGLREILDGTKTAQDVLSAG